MSKLTDKQKEILKERRVKFDILLPDTPQDKYHYMATKNPKLNKLKDEYNLKFE